DKLRNLGAEVEVAPQWQAHVVVDGNLITGQNPQSSLKSAEALIQALSA
ncbi:MAG: type 1 glutamine amidotransferase domain-containing protein, partial [Gammaproteobacteria bacterium]